jgi:ComF family protein
LCEEAVFSSSEDRIRDGMASAGVAGVGLAERSIVLKKPWFRPLPSSSRQEPSHQKQSGLAGRFAESLACVRFHSDRSICGGPLVNISRLPVFPACLEEIPALRGKVCSICGERVLSSYAEPDADGLIRCPVCRPVRRPFSRAVAYGSYDDGLRELVHPVKYNGARPAATVLGRMLAEAISNLQPAFIQVPVLLVPVPPYTGKRHPRGFNQVELIARHALKTLRGGPLQLRPEILVRTRDTRSQMCLTRHQRRENLRGACAVARVEEVTGREIVLVDDVYTTGTTVSECAKVLRRAGAVQVWVATVAARLKLASKCAEVWSEEIEESALAGAAGSRKWFQVSRFRFRVSDPAGNAVFEA